MTVDGTVIVGCNVENASFGLTICAERVAVSSAIAQGYSGFAAICVSLSGGLTPCGACRQFLMEFNPRMLVLLDYVDQPEGTVPEIILLADLLPRAFRLTVPHKFLLANSADLGTRGMRFRIGS